MFTTFFVTQTPPPPFHPTFLTPSPKFTAKLLRSLRSPLFRSMKVVKKYYPWPWLVDAALLVRANDRAVGITAHRTLAAQSEFILSVCLHVVGQNELMRGKWWLKSSFTDLEGRKVEDVFHKMARGLSLGIWTVLTSVRLQIHFLATETKMFRWLREWIKRKSSNSYPSESTRRLNQAKKKKGTRELFFFWSSTFFSCEISDFVWLSHCNFTSVLCLSQCLTMYSKWVTVKS